MDRRTERVTQSPPTEHGRPPTTDGAATTAPPFEPDQPTTPVPATDGRADAGTGRHASTRIEPRSTLHHQKDRFGGIKWGSAFFGWLTAVGTAVLLSGIVTAVGARFGMSGTGGPGQAVGELTQSPGATTTAGVVSAVVVALVLFVAYYCGGYVAGRMARFSGAKQGVAVWVWAVVIAVVVAVVVAVGGARFDLAPIGIPVDPATLGTAGIIAAVVALAVALLGAVLGGLAGMRFHRRVDRATPTADDGTAPRTA